MSEELKEDLPKVIEELEKKCKENPENVMAVHHLGLVYMKAGRIDDAINAMKKAIELDELSVESRINLGAIYFGQGKLDEAQKLNEEAVNAKSVPSTTSEAVSPESSSPCKRLKTVITSSSLWVTSMPNRSARTSAVSSCRRPEP